MKITDETISINGESRFATLGDALGANPERLTVASNHHGTHEKPSLYMEITNAFAPPAAFGTGNIEDIKKVILHIAKMSGLSVTFNDTSKLVLGDHVRIIGGTDYAGKTGIVHIIRPENEWPYTVAFNGGEDLESFARRELEKVDTTPEVL